MYITNLHHAYLCKLENGDPCQYRYYETVEIKNIGRFQLKKGIKDGQSSCREIHWFVYKIFFWLSYLPLVTFYLDRIGNRYFWLSKPTIEGVTRINISNPNHNKEHLIKNTKIKPSNKMITIPCVNTDYSIYFKQLKTDVVVDDQESVNYAYLLSNYLRYARQHRFYSVPLLKPNIVVNVIVYCKSVLEFDSLVERILFYFIITKKKFYKSEQMVDLLLLFLENKIAIQKKQFDQILTCIQNFNDLFLVVEMEKKKCFKLISQRGVYRSITEFIPDSVWKK
jgi:hypothetical protein